MRLALGNARASVSVVHVLYGHSYEAEFLLPQRMLWSGSPSDHAQGSDHNLVRISSISLWHQVTSTRFWYYQNLDPGTNLESGWV